MTEEKKPLSIMIATPTMGDVPMQYAHSIVAMILKTKERYPDAKIAMATTYRKMHHRARLELAEAFLQSDCTHLLWVDDDNIPREDDLNKLLAQDVPVISGLYFRRAEPFEPIIMVRRANGRGTERRPDLYRDPEKKMFKVHSTGLGFMLCQRKAIEDAKALNIPLFDIRGGLGEDIWFCNQLHGAGYDVWIDPKVEVAHLGEKIMVTGKTYDEFYKNNIEGLIKKALPIYGFTDEKELHYLAEISANSNFTVEVGCGLGRTTTVLSNSRRLVCTDNFVELDKFKKVLAGLKNKDVQYLNGDIDDLAENFPDDKADIIVVDGRYYVHEDQYEIVKNLIEKYWPKVGSMGRMIIAGFDESDQIKKAVDEFKEKMGEFANFNPIVGTTMIEIIKY